MPNFAPAERDTRCGQQPAKFSASTPCPGGEIGRHVRFRCVWLAPCGFESRLGHKARFVHASLAFFFMKQRLPSKDSQTSGFADDSLG